MCGVSCGSIYGSKQKLLASAPMIQVTEWAAVLSPCTWYVCFHTSALTADLAVESRQTVVKPVLDAVCGQGSRGQSRVG